MVKLKNLPEALWKSLDRSGFDHKGGHLWTISQNKLSNTATPLHTLAENTLLTACRYSVSSCKHPVIQNWGGNPF